MFMGLCIMSCHCLECHANYTFTVKDLNVIMSYSLHWAFKKQNVILHVLYHSSAFAADQIWNVQFITVSIGKWVLKTPHSHFHVKTHFTCIKNVFDFPKICLVYHHQARCSFHSLLLLNPIHWAAPHHCTFTQSNQLKTKSYQVCWDAGNAAHNWGFSTSLLG